MHRENIKTTVKKRVRKVACIQLCSFINLTTVDCLELNAFVFDTH